MRNGVLKTCLSPASCGARQLPQFVQALVLYCWESGLLQTPQSSSLPRTSQLCTPASDAPVGSAKLPACRSIRSDSPSTAMPDDSGGGAPVTGATA